MAKFTMGMSSFMIRRSEKKTRARMEQHIHIKGAARTRGNREAPVSFRQLLPKVFAHDTLGTELFRYVEWKTTYTYQAKTLLWNG
ncbi:hypothetical protein LJK88_09355 [Paenibacillus sp. P26]|nr:hypothetical protein LJK88_09355 [Paenibacillus sp. P26]UUZ89913.1 hypothetical protein LJK87_28250 [Paenibacillus sp. P25]